MVAWLLVPRVLADAGLPAPFGVLGYRFEFAVGTVALLSTIALWAMYGVVTLVLSRNSLASLPRSPWLQGHSPSEPTRTEASTDP